MGKRILIYQPVKNAQILRRGLLKIAERDACMVLEILNHPDGHCAGGYRMAAHQQYRAHAAARSVSTYHRKPDSAAQSGFFDVYKVVIQLGSILAVLVLYFQRLNPFSAKNRRREKGKPVFCG